MNSHTSSGRTGAGRVTVAVLGAVVLTGAAGFGGYAAGAASERSAAAPERPAASQAAPRQAAAAQAPDVRLQDAVATALKEQAGIATAADLDSGRDGYVWDFDVLADDDTWHEVVVDANSGKVLRTRTKSADDDDAADAEQAKKAEVTLVEAADAAEKKVSGAAVTGADLDDDYNNRQRLSWDLELQGESGAEYEVVVDAASGDVLAETRED
ncbi:PepSY domain-containing protein [Streptomyces boninensis]|uniref:PepSY domain-containing protein n=1 Tax=Streptomyces boninensis TaxID=2039455 RepID=UPI003B2264DC